MPLFRSLSDLPPALRGGVVSVGNFDGVHLGHAALLQRLNALARELAGPAVVLTFDPHPVQVLRPTEAPPPLTWTERKAELLTAHGVDAVVACPVDRAFLALSAAEFFQQIIVEGLAARGMVEGPNFFFGRGREGNIERLTELCRNAQLTLEIITPATTGDEWVSSSRVRQLLLTGDVAAANRLLTSPYRLRGVVARGAQRGRTLGFPTANIDEPATLLPADGVYAGTAYIAGQPFAAAIHIGPNPTFHDDRRRLEAHLIGWQGDLYGQTLEVEFREQLRGVQKFGSVEELRHQLQADVAAAARLFGGSA